MRILAALVLCLTCLSVAGQDPVIDLPGAVIRNQSVPVKIHLDAMPDGPQRIVVNGEETIVEFTNGESEFNHKFDSDLLVVELPGKTYTTKATVIPGWVTILPPLIAIILALVFREVLSSLFAGILSGSLILGFATGGPGAILNSFLAVIDRYILNALNDSAHLSIIVFSMLIGGMVALISRNGGMAGVVGKISVYAKNRKSGQFTTWLLGILIFFDDYANTLVVGNTMRPVTDRLKISREKLSYIVDSTAAPVAAIAFVTTWIGTELSYIKDGIDSIPALEASPYSIFLNSLAYSFYPVFTLWFILILVLKNRDFGPMYKAEKRAWETGKVSATEPGPGTQETDNSLNPKEGLPLRWYNALVPILIIVGGTLAGLYYTGSKVTDTVGLTFIQKLSAVIGNSDSYKALLWASLSAMIVTILMTLWQRLLKLGEVMETMLKGFNTMMPAVLILVLAWALAIVTEDLHTADFISSALITMNFTPVLLPLITFILAGFIAFSTGSSWSTMAILYPLILPSGWMLCEAAGYSQSETLNIFYNLVSCVLAGSVLGDHCSPISDTTILSSLATSCNHIDHVRTQLPYALTVGAVAVLIGTLPAALGVTAWITMPAGLLILYLIIHFSGNRHQG